MHCLHILNKNDSNLLNDCLRSMSEQDSLLLIEDAVYLLLKATAITPHPNIYCLTPDYQARGIHVSPESTIMPCSDEQFVELICSHEKSLTWY